ncbi:MAG TPA: ABC transporter substrate-binding protein [Anaeromyxobacter sp.]
MGLTGSFKETSFADLMQFYAVSKQTVALKVQLEQGGATDGVFFFANGDLVGASLAGIEGREAVRRALRLREGVFTVEVGARPPAPGVAETLRTVVMEEVVRLDEEDRARTSAPANLAAGGIAAGSGWWSAPDGRSRQATTPTMNAPPRAPPDAAAPAPTVPPPAAPAAPAATAPKGGPAHAPSLALVRPPLASGAAAAPVAPGASARPARAPEPAGAPATRAAAQSPDAQRAVRGAAAPREAPRRTSARRGTAIAIALAVAALGAFGAATWFARRMKIPETATAAAATGVRGVLDDQLVLGMVASFTGSNQERGRAMRIGWEIAIAEANGSGGVHGRKLRLVAQDDGYDPSRTGPAMKEVVETQGAFAIVGNVGTATAAVAIPYCAEKDAVFFGALSGADLLRRSPPDRLVFNFRAGLAVEAAAAVRYLVDVRRLPASRVAVLAQDDDFGRSGQRGALEQLRSYGVAEAAVLTLAYPRNTADLRDAIAKLRGRAEDVDAVVMIATYKPAATFVRKTKEAKLKLFYTTVSADSNGLADELVVSGQGYTTDVLLTQVVPVPNSSASALMRYRTALEKYAPGEKPGSTSLEAWIGAQIFLEALGRAGREVDTAKLVASIEGIRDWDIGIGAPITFGPADHQGSNMVFGWLLQPDGTYRQVELE